MKKLFGKLTVPCEKVESMVYDFHENRLDKNLDLRLRIHLMGCKDCRGYVELYRKVANANAVVDIPKIDEDLFKNTMEFLDQKVKFPEKV